MQPSHQTQWNEWLVIIRLALAFIMLVTVGSAIAQCAPGVPSAGNPGCIPPNQANSPYFQPPTAPGMAPAPEPIWEDRWGAIAVDASTGTFGASKDKLNKRDANDAAIKDCQSEGDRGCEVLISYYSQCVALAQASTGGLLFAETSPRLENAKTHALAECGKDSCSVMYTDCISAQRMN
ncbi:DUF4189 domain-containing protein [Luteibacter aegosomaticola]|uniref:DUF4189 domain-containing protein n=1 Tax=Luteibacter aegosomaticola TaxID=2911538 RepID=UPI003CCD490E